MSNIISYSGIQSELGSNLVTVYTNTYKNVDRTLYICAPCITVRCEAHGYGWWGYGKSRAYIDYMDCHSNGALYWKQVTKLSAEKTGGGDSNSGYYSINHSKNGGTSIYVPSSIFRIRIAYDSSNESYDYGQVRVWTYALNAMDETHYNDLVKGRKICFGPGLITTENGSNDNNLSSDESISILNPYLIAVSVFRGTKITSSNAKYLSFYPYYKSS